MFTIKTMVDKPHVFIVVDANNNIRKYGYSKEECQDWIDNL